MLIKRDVLEQIAAGRVTLAFRRWQRPSVKAGGTLLTPVGLLAITSVERVTPGAITERQAKRAGYASLSQLHAALASHREGELYRIEFKRSGADPRIALRSNTHISPEQRTELIERLDRLDARSSQGPWTRKILRLIAKYPERSASELAEKSGYEKEWLKLNVRKLKNLGLTESLNPGYRLSPRGQMLLNSLAN
jgi:hypothetical protein